MGLGRQGDQHAKDVTFFLFFRVILTFPPPGITTKSS